MIEKIGYSVAEVAVALDMNQKTVRKGVDSGQIPHVTIGERRKIVPAWWVRQQLNGPKQPPEAA